MQYGTAIFRYLLLLFILSFAGYALEKFTCDGTPYTVYKENTILQYIKIDDLSLHDIAQVNPTSNINAIGYNLLDNYIYGMITDRGVSSALNGNMVKIGHDGNISILGLPGTASDGERPYIVGATMDNQGIFYSFGLNKDFSRLYTLNIGIDTNTTTAADGYSWVYYDLYDTNGSLFNWPDVHGWKYPPTDIVYQATTKSLYGIRDSKLYRIFDIDTSTHRATVLQVPTDGDRLPDEPGGAWNTANGTIYYYDNNDPYGNIGAYYIYKLTPETNGSMRVEHISSVSQQTYFDATSCLPLTLDKEVNATKVLPGDVIQYRFHIYNPHDNVLDVNFSDNLPSALAYRTDSLNANGIFLSDHSVSTASIEHFDSKRLVITHILLPSNGWVEFNVTVTVDSTLTEEFTISNEAFIHYDNNTIHSDDPITPTIDDNTISVLQIPPHAIDDMQTDIPPGKSVQVSVLKNDIAHYSDMNISTLRIVNSQNQTVDQLIVPNEGIWDLNTSTGTIQFTPQHNFKGDPTPILYQVKDKRGNLSNKASIRLDYLQKLRANDDTLTLWHNQEARLSILKNDIHDVALNNTSLRIIDPKSLQPVTSYSAPQEGIWQVDIKKQQIIFTPKETFEGDPTPILYEIKDIYNNIARATITIHYQEDRPIAHDDGIIVVQDSSNLLIDVLKNDSFGKDGYGNGSIIITQLPKYGKVYIDDGGTPYIPSDDKIIYSPFPNTQGGKESFSYKIKDADGDEEEATVYLDITCTTSQKSDEGKIFNNITFILLITLLFRLYRKEEIRRKKLF